MSIWSAISGTVNSIGDSVGGFFSGFTRKSTAPEKSMVFTVAMIALSAKMARADGVTTGDELKAFKQVFHVPEKDIASVERVYGLAQQDVAGFESYAEQVAKLFAKKASILETVLDGLFHIAKADDAIHQDELTFLERVAEIFGFEEEDFARIRARHVAIDDDPFDILGVSRGASKAAIKQKYRKLVRELHPDKQLAAGVPAEMAKLAADRLARINVAYEQIMAGAGA